MKQERIWKALITTEEEEKILKSIRDSGVGRRLSEEALYAFSVGREEDFTIPTRVGDTLVHYYRPVNAGAAAPLLINMHGGGFVKGRRDQDIVFCRNICSRSGCCVLDIDYVPAPDMRYPGQVYACYDVLCYCAEHAAQLEIDAGKIAVGGHSAGGNLAAAMMLLAMDNQTFLPALLILDYPGMDNKTSAALRRNGTTNPRVPVWKADFYQKCYVDPEDAGEIYCSPGFADDDHLRQFPPTLLLYCDNDTFCDEDEAFANRLLALGVPVCAKRFFHSDHGFAVQRVGEYQQAEKLMLAALRTMAEEQ